MSKEMLVMVLGVWVIIVPYFGIPRAWMNIVFVVSGLIIVLIGFFLRTEALRRGGATRHQPFVENTVTPGTDNYGHERKEGINSFN